MASRHLRLVLFVATILSIAACGKPPDQGKPQPDTEPEAAASFAGSDKCVACHASEVTAWRGSHHDLAMQDAGAETVIGSFENTVFENHGVSSRFFRHENEYWVETDDAAGDLRKFRIAYTFGVSPLQQYLIEYERGRLQALPIAWDDDDNRWFHIYPGEYIGHDDELHWTRREQNWNYMCAECHSTNLQKNYTLKTDTFATSWSEIDVSCESCHGPASRHVSLAQRGELVGGSGLLLSLDDHGGASWLMNGETGIAERRPSLMSPPLQPEACGRCHARRGVLSADYEYGVPLLQTHALSLLDERLYFADGQIDDEVYVYGSFLQSKMYRAGVTCTDCHDPHTATLKVAGEVSGVCNGCHLPSRFATRDHHKHEPEGIECVDCHMTSRNYMVIDGRRDHSFRIPRPDISLATGAPNACTQCHDDKGDQWAASAASAWFGEVDSGHFAFAIEAGRRQEVAANDRLMEVIDDRSVAGIVRATALTLLNRSLSGEQTESIRRALTNPDALIRIGALRAMRNLPAQIQAQWSAGLLADPLRAVRLEAVSLLSPVRLALDPVSQEAFHSAEREYIEAQFAIAERPEAHGNLGNIYRARGDAERAHAYYGHAVRQAPELASVRINFADLYRELGRDDDAEKLLREGLGLNDADALLHHTLGLTLVRMNRHDEALVELARAVELQPGNGRFTYVYGVALNSLGQPDAALRLFRNAQTIFAGDIDIGYVYVTLLSERGQTAAAREAAAALLQRFPQDPRVSELVRSLLAPQ